MNEPEQNAEEVREEDIILRLRVQRFVGEDKQVDKYRCEGPPTTHKHVQHENLELPLNLRGDANKNAIATANGLVRFVYVDEVHQCAKRETKFQQEETVGDARIVREGSRDDHHNPSEGSYVMDERSADDRQLLFSLFAKGKQNEDCVDKNNEFKHQKGQKQQRGLVRSYLRESQEGSGRWFFSVEERAKIHHGNEEKETVANDADRYEKCETEGFLGHHVFSLAINVEMNSPHHHYPFHLLVKCWLVLLVDEIVGHHHNMQCWINTEPGPTKCYGS